MCTATSSCILTFQNIYLHLCRQKVAKSQYTGFLPTQMQAFQKIVRKRTLVRDQAPQNPRSSAAGVDCPPAMFYKFFARRLTVEGFGFRPVPLHSRYLTV